MLRTKAAVTLIFLSILAHAKIDIYEYPSQEAPIILQSERLENLVPFFKRGIWYKVGDKTTGKVGWLKTVKLDYKNDDKMDALKKLFPHGDEYTHGHGAGLTDQKTVTREEIERKIESLRQGRQVNDDVENARFKLLLKQLGQDPNAFKR